MAAMIDSVTAKIPCDGCADIHDGSWTRYDRDGQRCWSSHARLHVPGFAGATLAVRRAGDNLLELSGSLVRFLQGHNLYGTADLPALVTRAMERLTATLGLTPSAANRAAWAAGDFAVSRVDVARTYDLGTPAFVGHALAILGRELPAGRQAIKSYSGETVYCGERSRRVTVVFYNKSAALASPEGALPPGLAARERAFLLDWALGKLRVEVRLHQRELSRRNLCRGAAWTPARADGLLDERLARLIPPGGILLADAERAGLDRRESVVYELWLAGHDLRTRYSRSSLHRYRRIFLARGIDVARARPRHARPADPLGIAVPLAALFAGPGLQPPTGIARDRRAVAATPARRRRRIAPRPVRRAARPRRAAASRPVTGPRRRRPSAGGGRTTA
jgi:hypothetical protein